MRRLRRYLIPVECYPKSLCVNDETRLRQILLDRKQRLRKRRQHGAVSAVEMRQAQVLRDRDVGREELAANVPLDLVEALCTDVFNIQRHLTSRRTLRVFRDQAMLTWRQATVAA